MESKAINDKSSATTTIGTTTTTTIGTSRPCWPRSRSLVVSAPDSKNYGTYTMYGLFNDKFSSAFPCLKKGICVVIYRRSLPAGKHFHLFPLTNISLLRS